MNQDEINDNVRPWDLFINPDFTTEEKRNNRLDICKGCDRLFKPTRTCKECGCFMTAKTWLRLASCPLGKWGQEEAESKNTI